MPQPSFLAGKVFPIRIPTPFAVGDVYSYLIKDEKTVLVDCGHRSEESLEILRTALQGQGQNISDIDEIWLTHGHPDHFGQAALLADKSGATVYGHAKERANFAGNDDGDLFESFFKEQEIPRDLIGMMTDQLNWLQQYQIPIEPQWVEEGDVLSSGELEFAVKHVPGHAPGHLLFYPETEDGVIFGGDVLLGHISTNALINFDPDTGRRNRSLLQYRESLRWMRELQGTVLPGHGDFIENIREVAGHHLTEHEKRYEKIKRMLAEKPFSLYELALATFPDAMKKGAAFLVLSEVLGYLDWGMEEGEVAKKGSRYKIRKV